MKKCVQTLLLVCFILFGSAAKGQGENNYKVDFGFQLNQFQDDFGLGVNLSTPILNRLSVHLRANAMYFEMLKGDRVEWQPYYNVMVGFSSVPYKINEAIALYGEGGTIMILPSSEYSSESTKFGGYGIFGFEFYFDEGFCYFLEAGGIGSGATADKLPGKPIYSNGFLMSVGLKIKLK